MQVFCACCNKDTEHSLERVGLEFHVICQTPEPCIVIGTDGLPVVDEQGNTVKATKPCGHTIKFPKTRDIAELGQWIAEYQEENKPLVTQEEADADATAMDDIVLQFNG